MALECSVCTHIKVPADEVWEWMSDVRRLLTVNLFHDAVLYDEPVMEAGPRIQVPHSFHGIGKQMRVAHVRDYRKYFIGWGETKAKEEKGVDAFPHYQSFEVVPLQDDTCVVVNRLRGVFQWPGAARFGPRAFHRWSPVILQDDNANIAVAVGAIRLEDKPKLKAGLLLWPLMGLGGKILQADARKRIVMATKSKSGTPRVSSNGSDAEKATGAGRSTIQVGDAETSDAKPQAKG
jgi:hypothetical protein